MEITNMIIDDQYEQEHVTVHFHANQQDYSITFDKADLEIINAWVFKEDISLPANITKVMEDAIRQEVKAKI